MWLAAAPAAAALLDQANALYFQGDSQKAMAAYEKAVAQSSTTAAAWLNGAVLLEELDQHKKAVLWYQRAASLQPDADVEDAWGWALLRAGEAGNAKARFEQALGKRPDHPYALLGLARVELRLSHPAVALELLDKAGKAAPLFNLVPYYRAQAQEMLHQSAAEISDYKQAVIADSYFMEGREALARAEIKYHEFNDAWKQISKILDVEPKHKRLLALLGKISPLLTRKTSDIRPPIIAPAQPYLVESDAGKSPAPLLRVGIGTNQMGKPMPRPMASFSVNVPFWVVDPKTLRKLTRGSEDETWHARVKPVKKKLLIEFKDDSGKVRLLRAGPLLIKPETPSKGLIVLDKIAFAPGSNWTGIADKTLRGALEISIYPAKRSLKLVNIVDLENYTHGVLAAEMPVQSPLEALKAQAVVARSHALFIKTVTRRHRKEGYDVCDEQHCQVYAGVRAETKRSRDVVDATRGVIATYKGKVAHVIYSSNCGGRTQSGRDVAGWGDVPYWLGVRDAPDPSVIGTGQTPQSPWELRQWLQTTPPSFCRPSTFVHPSHYRWTRVVSYRELEEKLDRKLKIGKLVSLRPGRRSASGNLNSLLVTGSKKKVKVTSEMTIRSLLGLGPLRSTMFVFNRELGPDKRPESLLISGGGWGHGVGLCQSGAMGRAEAGQTYEDIIKAYFKGTEVGRLDY